MPNSARQYWLMKSEPDEFSIEDLERVGSEPWSGVRNYQARNFMWKQMRVGDGVFFYHSNTAAPGIAGLAVVASTPYPDATQFDVGSDDYDAKSTRENPRWWLVDVGFERALAHVITLDELRNHVGALDDFALLRRGNRLSVLPVTSAQWNYILSLERTNP